MNTLDGIDEKSMNYVPTYQEMGYTTLQFDSINWENQSECRDYENRMLKFQLKHREKLKKIAIKSKTKKMSKYISHWYNVLKKEEIEALIRDSLHLSDNALDKIQQGQSLQSMVSYYENLRYKIKKGSFEIYPADESKIRFFPRYIHATNKLTGSVYSFTKLWSHVFSTRTIKNGTITS